MASVIILYDLLQNHPMALLYNVHYSHLCACIYVFIYCICFLWDLRLQLVVRLLLLMHTEWDKSKLDKDICEHMSIWVQMSKFSVEMRVNAERLWVEETKMKKNECKDEIWSGGGQIYACWCSTESLDRILLSYLASLTIYHSCALLFL